MKGCGIRWIKWESLQEKWTQSGIPKSCWHRSQLIRMHMPLYHVNRAQDWMSWGPPRKTGHIGPTRKKNSGIFSSYYIILSWVGPRDLIRKKDCLELF